MKMCSKCKVLKSRECFAPNKLTKDKLQSWCRECKNAHDRARRATDLDYKARRREASKTEEAKKKKKAYRQSEKGRKIVRQNRKQQKQDKARRRNYRTYYKLKAEGRVPSWVQPKDTLPFYQLADQMGEEYTVDHIIPLRSKLVCGLHTPSNLQVMTSAGNAWKATSLFEGWESVGLRP